MRTSSGKLSPHQPIASEAPVYACAPSRHSVAAYDLQLGLDMLSRDIVSLLDDCVQQALSIYAHVIPDQCSHIRLN